MNKEAFIHRLFENPVSGPEIEALSFLAIERESRGDYRDDQWEIVRRMIHTAGDPELAAAVRISADAIAAGMDALQKGVPIYVDSNMIRAGLSMARLRAVNDQYSADKIFCHVADSDVSRLAVEAGLPRSLFALRKARAMLNGGIAVFGNAPVALLELNRMIIEESLSPALVLAMPVGFVHVVESKDEFLTLKIPHVTILGRRGGSALAVSVIHALCGLASRHVEKSQ
jgi:precorrin-8X/cobalt-precorrin-8 methylmutase